MSALALFQSLENIVRCRGPADDRPLRPDHLQGGLLEGREIAGSGVLDQQALIASIVGFAHGRLHAYFCSSTVFPG